MLMQTSVLPIAYHTFTSCALLLQVKVLTSAGSNVPVATPVAISTTLPPLVSALNQQGTNVFPPPVPPLPTNIQPSSQAGSTTIQDFLRKLTAYTKGIWVISYHYACCHVHNHCHWWLSQGLTTAAVESTFGESLASVWL